MVTKIMHAHTELQEEHPPQCSSNASYLAEKGDNAARAKLTNQNIKARPDKGFFLKMGPANIDHL